MLVITRKQGDRIKIGGALLTVVAAQGQVRIGIDAPREIEIKREELMTQAEIDVIKTSSRKVDETLKLTRLVVDRMLES